jgi:FAD synthetase
MFLSFNGGKDCTVLIDLIATHFKSAIKSLKIIYFQQQNPFPEIEEFVQSCEPHYGIKISNIETNASMKETLTKICNENANIEACFMGTCVFRKIIMILFIM